MKMYECQVCELTFNLDDKVKAPVCPSCAEPMKISARQGNNMDVSEFAVLVWKKLEEIPEQYRGEIVASIVNFESMLKVTAMQLRATAMMGAVHAGQTQQDQV